MRRKISLYIADNLVDISDDSLVLLNYTFEDLSNPTVIKNSYSKSITLEGTDSNNKVFGDLWRFDRMTVYGDKFSGVYFDATRKTPFKILDENNTILMAGYCKLTNIKRVGNSCTYTINLYGGLGSFFYNLEFNPDGSKRTLNEMVFINWYQITGEPYRDNGALTISRSWEYLADPDAFSPAVSGDEWVNVINFAPCYNGYPADFDSKSVIVSAETDFQNVPQTYQKDGVTYGPKPGTKSVKLSLSQQHTEWEIRDLRWYLQRPIISMKEIIRAICLPENNGGYEVELDNTFFNDNNPSFSKAWVTMPLIKVSERNATNWSSIILKHSLTPCEYLVSYSKMYGLVFIAEPGKKKIRILTRKSFFREHYHDVLDLTGRVDSESISLSPNVADHKYYQMGGAKPILGDWAKLYQRDFGREYGIQRINTGYDFDLETTILTKDNKLVEAVDVTESSKSFFQRHIGKKFINWNVLTLPDFDTVTGEYWGTDADGNLKSDTQQIPAIEGKIRWDDFIYNGRDWLPKPQFHDDNMKAVKGENVLLMYNGTVPSPTFKNQYGIVQRKKYWITNDTKEMLLLNNEKPCWATFNEHESHTWGDSIEIDEFPSFRRNFADGTTISDTFDYGEPLAVSYSDRDNTKHISIYTKHWQRYLNDRYDTDTKVMKCKVDMRGIQVGQMLLGRFFYYGNALWVLNKIENYSLTTDDLVECEFVKVKDKNNYIE